MASAGADAADDTTVAGAYRQLTEAAHLVPDAAQLACARALDEVRVALEGNRGAGISVLRRPGSGRDGPVRGVYIWGSVGRGKTLLMDLFYERVRGEAKRRVHFNEFMDEVHAAMTAFRDDRRAATRGRRDPVPAVAAPIAEACRLVCLDEFQVTDIADAMLLGRLFETLFEAGVTIVATANTAPDRLYEGGLNRGLVLPFIELLKQRTRVLHLEAATDYRRRKLGAGPVFFFGTGKAVRGGVDRVWTAMVGGQMAAPETVDLIGRCFTVPAQAMGAARFSFAELCEAPLGPRDYLRLARRYHSFFIDDIPTLERARTDAARRFMALIDTLYDRHLRLVASFEAPLDELGADSRTSEAFQRTVSRLIEMQSAAYLGAVAQDAADR